MHDKPTQNESCSPLRVLFLTTSMPVGGAETLLVNLIRRLDRDLFAPELCCLKELGPLGEEMAQEIPTASNLLSHKFDLRVLERLVRLFREHQIDALVTVGAGDKMFWGRLAAWLAGVKVIACALHSTGWPDSIGRLNRWLTPLTDAFIGVASAHGQHLVERERFPQEKVYVIPNGVDVDRFAPMPGNPQRRTELGIPEGVPTVGILAALRPEKNHPLFLQSAKRTLDQVPETHFVLIGEGPERPQLETLARDLGIEQKVHFLGTRSDIPELLAMLDLVVLSSHNEAFPVSILEAMAAARPVISTRVGSVDEAVVHGKTGYLVPPGEAQSMADRIVELLQHPLRSAQMGAAGRERVCRRWSLEQMVEGYENLLESLYASKRSLPAQSAGSWPATPLETLPNKQESRD